MSVEIYLSTVLWILSIYLLLGVVLFLPTGWLAYRQLGEPKAPFWKDLIYMTRWRWVPVQIALWPLALREAM